MYFGFNIKFGLRKDYSNAGIFGHHHDHAHAFRTALNQVHALLALNQLHALLALNQLHALPALNQVHALLAYDLFENEHSSQSGRHDYDLSLLAFLQWESISALILPTWSFELRNEHYDSFVNAFSFLSRPSSLFLIPL